MRRSGPGDPGRIRRQRKPVPPREITGEMIARLPAWAQDLIRELRQDNGLLTAENRQLEARLADHVAAAPAADTVLVSPDGNTLAEIPDRPLGVGVTIRFADFFEVRYAGDDGGELVVETDGVMAVYPREDFRIVVTRAG
jgi:hypothetical protein